MFLNRIVIYDHDKHKKVKKSNQNYHHRQQNDCLNHHNSHHNDKRPDHAYADQDSLNFPCVTAILFHIADKYVAK